MSPAAQHAADYVAMTVLTYDAPMQDVRAEHIKAWAQPHSMQQQPQFQLPPHNPYIPSDFTLIDCSQVGMCHSVCSHPCTIPCRPHRCLVPHPTLCSQ